MDNQTALALIKAHEAQHDLVFAKPEDLRAHKMFVAEVTVLHATQADFHSIKGGKVMPKSHHTDAIGEAAGVYFIEQACSTRKESEYVWVGRAQGKKRQPDGSWRTSHAQEYEFDAQKRAEEDVLAHPEDYPTEVSKRKHLLETARFGRQRAGTGARLKVIRELAHIPIAFTPADIQKAIVVSRIAVNTEELLADPDMRKAVISMASGAADQIYGPEPRKAIEADAGIEVPAEEVSEPPADDDPFDEQAAEAEKAAAEQAMDPKEKARLSLQEWLISDVLKPANDTPQARQKYEGRKRDIKALIDNKDATLEVLQAMLDKCAAYESRQKARAGAA